MRYLSKQFHRQKLFLHKGTSILLSLALIATLFTTHVTSVQSAGGYALVLLSRYNCTLRIGQSCFLTGVASNGKRIVWKSSKSSVASVNTYGQITAKKAGTCKITGKVTGGEASCQVTVEKTQITLSASNLTIENGTCATIKASTSNGSPVTWKSQKSSVATIDENGRITARKTGETNLTAKADGSTKVCRLTVKKPKITLSRKSASLYRKQSLALQAKTSSGRSVTWKTKKKSVATVSKSGRVTAIKHGTAIITANLDGVTKECEITVKSPTISLSKSSATIKKGKSLKLTAAVSSGNAPAWKSSKSAVASVDSMGKVTAKKKGSCYIYASEDGTKETCHIQVTA